MVDIHVDYDGRRIAASFDPRTSAVRFADGPLTGKSFKSPSGAAGAVVTRLRPGVDPNRNGWTFWTITGTGVTSPGVV
jgi:hypothetical protein